MYRSVNVKKKTPGVFSNMNLFKKKKPTNEVSEEPPLLMKLCSKVSLKSKISFEALQGELEFVNPDNDGRGRDQLYLPAELMARLTPLQHEAVVWHEKHVPLTNEGIEVLKDAYEEDLSPENQDDMVWVEDLVNETDMRFRQMRGRLEMLKEAMKGSEVADDVIALVNENLKLVEFHISCLEAWKKLAADQIWKMNKKVRMAERKEKIVLITKRIMGKN